LMDGYNGPWKIIEAFCQKNWNLRTKIQRRV
jgi:hypothetical protein